MKIKKKLLIISLLFLVFINIFSVDFQSFATNADLSIVSEGAILIEASTGKILYGKNENKKLYPASTTKILTAIIAIEKCSLTEKITASYDAVMSLPSGYANAAIQPNETIEFKDLLDMYLIHSANEIGTIFAEHISGSVENFAVLMNQKAKSLGCTNTNFTNPSGIHDPNHYTTPQDMAIIARYCMQNETFRSVVSKPSCTIEPTDKYEKRYFRNTNDLLNKYSDYYYEYAIGTKTGFTSQAKRCLIATAQKDGIELITVILGNPPSNTDTRYTDTINLFEYGFNNFKFKKIATKNTIMEELVVKNATKETENLSLIIKNDLTILTSKNLSASDIKQSVTINENITAPVSEGDILGKITYSVDGEQYVLDLIANHNVEKFDFILILKQIVLALIALFILSKLVLPKKKSKKKKYKKKNYRK